MTIPEPAPGTDGAARDPDPALRAGLVAGAAYVLVGWRALLVPSLIRFVAPAYGQADAGMGAYFLATSVAYGVGSLSGGRLIRAFGSHRVLPAAMLLLGIGLLVQGSTGAWVVFAGAGFAAGVGASSADVGIQALTLDLFPHARGRALNLLHVSYGVGALLAPLILAALVGAGIAWSWLITGSGVAVIAGAVALFLTIPRDAAAIDLPADAVAAKAARGGARPGRLPPFLLVMGLAIVCYVAAEQGVSDWLVRYLDRLSIAEASLALTLFWGGIVIGRLVFARIGNRLDPRRSASVLGIVGGAVLLAALLLPVSQATPLLFLCVGTAFGPIFPLIVAAAGARMPRESATVTATLVFAAVIGAVAYPPLIGFLSAGVGIQVAMLGTAALACASGAAAWAAGRLRG